MQAKEATSEIPSKPARARRPSARKPKISGNQIKINKPSHLKLIDTKILPKDDRAGKILGLSVIAGLIVGIAIAAYLYFTRSNSGKDYQASPEIEVPAATSTAQIVLPPASAVLPPVPQSVPKVVILGTPTGSLNVRTGPATTYRKIGQVKPGESFVLVSEDKEHGWYQINLASGTGWVTKQYARVR